MTPGYEVCLKACRSDFIFQNCILVKVGLENLKTVRKYLTQELTVKMNV